MRLSFTFIWLVLIVSCTNSNRVSENSGKIELDNSVIIQRNDNWFSLQEDFSDERRAGADFIAFGRNPDWQVVITSNNDLSLITKTDFGSFGVPNVEGLQPQDLNAMVYGAQSSTGTISVMVFTDSCMSHKNGLLPNRVKISAKKRDGVITEFTGCGLYLNDPALHDIWAVKNWSAQSIDEKIPAGAYLEFNFQSNRIYGNLGCGDITGYFIPMGSKMKIYGMDYSDKKCENESISMRLFDSLNFSTHALVKDGLQLSLINQGDTITFMKVD